MKRRLFTLTLFALVALVAVVAALGANAQPRVTEATGTGFPARSYILTLPHGMQLKPGSVHVFENGRPVPDLTVTPAEESTSRQFGAVLVIDASTSMEGEPERAAFSAARVFAAQRKGHEQLALVTYNITPTVVLPFTTEQARIDAALSKQPPFLFGTHIYDAITHSLDLLQTGRISAGTIVVLSDGQEHAAPNDTAAHETLETAAAAARAAHVRVFAVGLKSRVSRLAALRKLARDTGGRYVETTSIRQLSGIYKELGSSLASEYLLRYRSLAGPDKHIAVTVRIDGVNDSRAGRVPDPGAGGRDESAGGPVQAVFGRHVPVVGGDDDRRRIDRRDPDRDRRGSHPFQAPRREPSASAWPSSSRCLQRCATRAGGRRHSSPRRCSREPTPCCVGARDGSGSSGSSGSPGSRCRRSRSSPSP